MPHRNLGSPGLRDRLAEMRKGAERNRPLGYEPIARGTRILHERAIVQFLARPHEGRVHGTKNNTHCSCCCSSGWPVAVRNKSRRLTRQRSHMKSSGEAWNEAETTQAKVALAENYLAQFPTPGTADQMASAIAYYRGHEMGDPEGAWNAISRRTGKNRGPGAALRGRDGGPGACRFS